MRIAIPALTLALLLASAPLAATQAPVAQELLASARLWEVRNRPDLARLALEKLLLVYPDQPEALLELTQLELLSGNTDVAARLLKRAQAAHPGERSTQQLEDLYRVSTRDRLRMATISRLQEQGKADEAVAALRELFPHGAPAGLLGLQYYRIIAGSRRGWEEAREGFSRLLRENPENPQYALALADHLLDHPATRPVGLKMLAALADNPDADHQRVMDLWRGALTKSSAVAASSEALRAYLQRAPDDKVVRQELALRERDEWTRQLLRDHTLARAWPDNQREQLAELERLLLAARSQKPQDPDVLESLGLLRLHQKRYDEAWELFLEGRTYATPETRAQWDRGLVSAMFRKWSDESDVARGKSDLELAARKQRAAIDIHEEAYYRLGQMADRLAQDGPSAEAEDLYRRVLALDEGNDTSLRGLVKLLTGSGRSDEALVLLQGQVPQRPQDRQRFAQLRAGVLSNEADRSIAAGRVGEGLRQLEQAQTLAPQDPWIRYDLASLYVRLGLPRQARDLMEEGDDPANGGGSEMRYAHALLLASLDDDVAATALLDRIPGDQRSEGMQRLARRLRGMKWRRESAFALAQADQEASAGHYDHAQAIYESLLAQHGDDLDLHLAYARLLRHRGDRPSAVAELNRILTLAAPGDVDTNLAVIRERLYLGDVEGARTLVAALLQRQPANADVLLQAGRIELQQRQAEEAMAYFRQAQEQGSPAAAGEIASLQQRLEGGFVTSGPSFRYKPGDDGVSTFSDVELPIEWRKPVGLRGEAFVHVDPAHVGAGRLPAVYDRAGLFGKVQAYGPASLAQFPNGAGQSQSGADIGAGYQSDDWRFDLGTTPLGFLVQDVVGGVQYEGKLGAAGYRVDVSRRPVTSSLLSYAGARDPVTGEVWGGVRSNGIDLGLSRYEQDWDAAVTVGFHRLTGRKVPGNNEFSARLSTDRELIHRDDVEVSLGATLTQWNYVRELSHYTFGQGGYYSPQSYTSLGLPLEWTGRIGRWSYRLKGSVSYAWSRSNDSPFYPGDQALQAMATGSPLPSGYSRPVYGGGSSSGIGYAAQGALEYQINRDYFIGGAFDLDRSAYYSPNFFTLYLRRNLFPWTQPVPYPPRSPKPYSQY